MSIVVDAFGHLSVETRNRLKNLEQVRMYLALVGDELDGQRGARGAELGLRQVYYVPRNLAGEHGAADRAVEDIHEVVVLLGVELGEPGVITQ